MHKTIILILLAFMLLAGCSQSPGPDADPAPSPDAAAPDAGPAPSPGSTMSPDSVDGSSPASEELSLVSRASAYCEGFDNSTIQGCYLGFAFTERNLSICEASGDEFILKKCAEVKAMMQDQSVCAGLGLEQRLECYDYAAVFNKNLSICDYIEEDRREYCYSNYGRAMDNISVCRMIQSQQTRDWCEEGTVQYADAASCEGLGNKKDDCLYQIAIRDQDPSICARMEGLYVSMTPAQCLSVLSLRMMDPNVCDETSDPKTAEQCYEYILHGKNRRFCDLIDDPGHKELCIASTG